MIDQRRKFVQSRLLWKVEGEIACLSSVMFEIMFDKCEYREGAILERHLSAEVLQGGVTEGVSVGGEDLGSIIIY